ncbi:hypothetical protein SAMN03159341_10135 [Paenibacillus sp. 1_12]|uniref:hypothetical protein n=1 Tax=Paenibacillus sp. 1_12 TaxID=1566278 RepID=UPI0008ED3BDA|nr:hypothetical protein [Paenibacillus sp. 1_12]SFK67461.1 hypothetical protein SAMN03159341_10135 [Paenibacillus sp. 1_12]
MASGVVDIQVSKELAENTMVIIYNCEGGLANDLHLIRDGHEVTLQRADLEGRVRIVHEQGSDCSFNYIEVDPLTARKFRMRNGSRFTLNYDPDVNRLRLRRITTSQAYGLLKTEPRKHRDGSIIIGYTLLSWLGIPSLPNQIITLANGSISKKLKVIIPDNELETDFHLTAVNLRRFGLAPGKKWALSYNQLTQTMKVLPAAATASRRAKPKTAKSVRRR